jgi:hydroxyacylglutathione hydrolase
MPSAISPLPEPRSMSLDEVVARLDQPNFVVLDTREDRAGFLARHLLGSLYAPAAKFQDFAGSYLAPENDIVLVVERPAQAGEFVRQLVRIGFDHIAGVLSADALGSAPESAVNATRSITFAEVPALLADGDHHRLLDVRRATEYSGAHLHGARNIAHTRLQSRLGEVPPEAPLLVHCASGLRAAGACAFLERNGREVICIADAFTNAPSGLLSLGPTQHD